MATFAVVVSDPESGHSYQFEIDGQDANRFLGRDIGEEVDGDAVGLPGYAVEITGGSDAAGRPMRGDVAGAGVTDVLLDGGVGFNPTRDGERRRVSVRGREVSDETVQLNLKVTERGEGRVGVLIGDEEPEPEAEEEADESEAEEAAESEEEEAEEAAEAEEEAEEADAEDAEAADEETADDADEE